MWRAIAVVVALAIPAGGRAQVPLWCGAEALTLPEQLVCADPVLSRLDLDLDTAYRAAGRVAPDLDQLAWLAERDACGFDVLCLETAYRDRIAVLGRVAAGEAAGAAPPPFPVPAPGEGEITMTPLPPPGADGRPAPEGRPSALPPPQPAPVPAAPERETVQPPIAPEPGLAIESMLPRPWCAAPQLNPTERAICGQPILSRLDALLELVYGRTIASDEDLDQLRWLRIERDACGADIGCIAGAYSDRIQVLNR